MSKRRIRNMKSLQFWADRAQLDSRENAAKVLDLYKAGKIRDVTTARTLLEEFSATNSKTRGKAARRFQKIQDNLEKHGLISQPAIRKKKLRDAQKKATYSTRIVVYEINQGEKENKEVAETTKTKYFKGFKQTYTGTVLLTVPSDEVEQTDVLFDQVKGKLVRAKGERDQFYELVSVLEMNPELNEFWSVTGYQPDGIF